VVVFAASALDAVDGSLPVSCVPASGSIFSIGATTVSCSATDSSRHTASGSFSIEVRDTTPPTVALIGPTGGEITGTILVSAVAHDAVGVSAVSFFAGAQPIGTAVSPPFTVAWATSGIADGTTVALTARAYDPAGNETLSAPVMVTVRAGGDGDGSPELIVVVTPDAPAPRPAGTTVLFTANVTGGVAPFKYKWNLFNGSEWKELQDWSSSPTLAWTAARPNPLYRIGVLVRGAETSDDGQKIASIPYPITGITSAGITISSAPPYDPGQPITFAATAQGGTGPYLFKWLLFDGDDSTTLADWSTSQTLSWTPTACGPKYKMTLLAKSSGNPLDWAEAHASIELSVSGLRSVTLAADLPSPQQVGVPITFSALPTGGGSAIQFKWLVYDGDEWSTVQDWGTASSFVWTPSVPGTFNIAVWARSLGTSDDQKATAAVAFTVDARPRMSGVALTSDVGSPQLPGATILLTAMGSGGVPPYQYKFLVFDGERLSTLQDWSEAATAAWRPAVVNPKYRLIVWARGAGYSAFKPEAVAWLPFAIQIPPPTAVTLAPDLAEPRLLGTPIVFAANAIGGEMPHEFKRWIHDGSDRRLAQNWSATPSLPWIPTLAGEHKVVAWVRSAGRSRGDGFAAASSPFQIAPQSSPTRATGATS
jgi:hypothetical protein